MIAKSLFINHLNVMNYSIVSIFVIFYLFLFGQHFKIISYFLENKRKKIKQKMFVGLISEENVKKAPMRVEKQRVSKVNENVHCFYFRLIHLFQFYIICIRSNSLTGWEFAIES